MTLPGRRKILELMAVVALTGAPSLAAAQSSLDDGSTDGGDAPVAPTAVRVEALDANRDLGPIAIDGRLDEPDWDGARIFTGFTQGEPVEGASAEHDTEVRVLFGDEAIWVAARMYDTEPEAIVDRLGRRDSHGQWDLFVVQLDPNQDRLTGYLFGVSAANVQSDAYLYDDTRMDAAWDAVWSSAVQIDEHGWTVELRIPLSQIRYEASAGEQVWGMNFSRSRTASNEQTYYSLVSKTREGRVSQMAEVDGILVSRPSRRVEALPYVVQSLHRGPSTPGDPFFDGSDMGGRFGLDLSYGLGAAFTLDATINPDFGQVEADPAVINLTAFETFFEERRPFFVEDARVFDFSLSGHRDQLFYSRRVGRAPHGGAPAGAEFELVPDNATILGAAKLSGRTSGGLSVGAMAAVTGDEFGEGLFDDGTQAEFLVEPRSEYGVFSLAQDFNEGASQVRGIATAMRRELPGDGAFDWLPSSAFNGGARFQHQWADRTYAVNGFLTASHVRGSPEAMTRLQRASNHYFQRPDATRFGVDETATSLSGINWRLGVEKQGGEHWTGSVWAAEVTKGFEINDLGYSTTAERLDGGARIGYREIRPGDLFRNYSVSFWSYHNWSHEALDDMWSLDSWHRARLRGSYSLNANAELLNYWNVRTSASYSPEAMSRSATRGGPMMVDPASTRLTLNVSSDRRKQVSVGANVEIGDDHIGEGGSRQIRADIRVRPSDNVEVSVTPRWETSRSGNQYVTATSTLAYDPTFGSRYLFADLERRSFSMVTRLDWTFSPTLSLQLYAQPLLSSGDYVRYKQLAEAQTYDFLGFQPGTGQVVDGGVECTGICELDGTQHVDFDQDGRADYSFSDRDFNVRSLVGNAVVRWEYRPGSTIYFVWQRRQIDRANVGDFDFGRDREALFNAPADNRFIVKVNYWLGL
jgi:hypothetical protein